jgi:hypothetical protein
MKDHMGNGISKEERKMLTEIGMYQISYRQDGNFRVIVNESWRFADKINLLKGWFSIDTPRGIHLSLNDLNISVSKEITMEEYYHILLKDAGVKV